METATLPETTAMPQETAIGSFDPFGDIPRRDPSDETGERELEPLPAWDDAAKPKEEPAEAPVAGKAEVRPEPQQEQGATDAVHQLSVAEYNQLLADREALQLLRDGKEALQDKPGQEPDQSQQETPQEPQQEPPATVKPYRVPEVPLLDLDTLDEITTNPQAFAEYSQTLIALGAQAILDSVPAMVSQHVSQAGTANYLIHRFIEDNPEYYDAPYVVKEAVQELLKENPGANPYRLMKQVGQKLKMSAAEAQRIVSKNGAPRKSDQPPPTGPNAGLTRDQQGRFQEKALSTDATEAVFQNWRLHESAGEESMRKMQDAGLI